MMAWSVKPGQAYLSKDGIRKIKSALTNDIFKREMLHYLPKAVKKTVDEIVDQMERMPVINECCQTWWDLQCQIEDFYSEKERRRSPLSKQKEVRGYFRPTIQLLGVVDGRSG